MRERALLRGIVGSLLLASACLQGRGIARLLGERLLAAIPHARVPAAPPPDAPASAAAPPPAPSSSSLVPPAAASVSTPPPLSSAAATPVDRTQNWLGRVRVVPEVASGKLVGLRLSGIRQDSLLSMLGLANGDRLISTNGYPATTPENLLQAYAELRTKDRFEVLIERGGTELELVYHLR